LVEAGYKFQGSTVVGNCSYYTVRGGSGRGGGYRSFKTYYNQTCTWDLYGTLLKVTPGAPAVPPPLYVSGTRTVYAQNASGDTTGTDSALLPYHGFVNTPGSHYHWITSNAYAVLQQAPHTFTATLMSDGDVPLNIASVRAGALQGSVVVDSNTCTGAIPVGATCGITVTYDPTKLCSPTGLSYDTLDIGLTSDAGQAQDFVQRYTIVIANPARCED
jgi:hypothetical protein